MEPTRKRGAGGIVIGDAAAIAMVRNRAETKWFFPKGHVEPDESDEEAARREIQEETGLSDLELLDDLGEYERFRIGANDEYDRTELKEIKMFLFSALPHSTLAPTMEIEETRWVPFVHVAELLEDAKDRAWFTTVFERVRQAIQRD